MTLAVSYLLMDNMIQLRIHMDVFVPGPPLSIRDKKKPAYFFPSGYYSKVAKLAMFLYISAGIWVHRQYKQLETSRILC